MNKVTHPSTQEYKQVLLDGCSIDYRNKLTVCKISDYYRGKVKRLVYQVHCSDSRLGFSKFYRTLNEALEKFFELRSNLKR